MDLLTGGLILGSLFVGAKVLGGSKGSTKATTGTTPPDCATPKDCDALFKCAGPILAKATAADISTLTKMSAQAASLGCTGLVKQITDVLATLSKGDPGTGEPGSYEIVQSIGAIPASGAKPGDMLIIGLSNADKTRKYVTPVTYTSDSGDNAGKAMFEKTLAELALDKFKKTAPVDPSPLLGSGAIFLGAPPDLPNGTTFNVRFAGFPSPGPGNVLGVVTAEQMKSSTLVYSGTAPALTASGTASPSYVAPKASFAGEEDFLAPNNPFGSGFGSRQRNIGSNFGGGSRFGKTNVGG